MASLPRKPESIFEDLLCRLRVEHVSEVERLNVEILQLRQLVQHKLATEVTDPKEQAANSSGDDSVGELEPTPRLIRPRASPTLANRRSPSGREHNSSNSQISTSSHCKAIAESKQLETEVDYPSSGKIGEVDYPSSGEIAAAALTETMDLGDITDAMSETSVTPAALIVAVGPQKTDVAPERDASPRSPTQSQTLQQRILARARALRAAKEDSMKSTNSANAKEESHGQRKHSKPLEQDRLSKPLEQEESQGERRRSQFLQGGKVRTRDELFQAMRAASSHTLKNDPGDSKVRLVEVSDCGHEESFRPFGSEDGTAKTLLPVIETATNGGLRFEGDEMRRNSSLRSSAIAPTPSDPDYFRFELRDEWADEQGGERNTNLARAQSRMTLSRRRSTKNLESLVLEEETSGCQKLLLHPSGHKRLCWDSIGILMIGWDMVMIPLQAFEPKENLFLMTTSWATLIFWTLEIPVSCITGYHENGIVVLDFKKILIHYLRTWFGLDLFIVTIDWFFRLQTEGSNSDGEADKARLLRSFRFLRFLRTIRLLRLLKLKKIMQEIEDRINSEAVSIYFNVFKIVMFLLALNHIIACAWYAIGWAYHSADMENWIHKNNLVDEPMIYRYATSLHWSLTQFTPASMEIRPFNVGERLFAIVVLLFALVAFSSFVSSLTSSMTHLRNIRTNETRQFWLLRRYLRDQSIPSELARRIQRYLEYAYQRRQNRVQASEVSVLNLLSDRLKDELNHEAFVDLIQAHPLFAQLNPRNKLFFKATRMEAMAQGDIVFSFGFRAKMMYCLQETMTPTEGLEYIMPDDDGRGGSRTHHVTDVEWMCETSLWLECWMHMGDMMAISECHIVQVDAAKFTKAVVKSPMAAVTAQAYAARFLERVNSTAKCNLTDLTSRIFKIGDLINMNDMRRFSLGGPRADYWLFSVKDHALNLAGIKHTGTKSADNIEGDARNSGSGNSQARTSTVDRESSIAAL